MFEKYTEKARRVIFFARYEASGFGSPYIESEHLLLGLLREDKVLVRLFFRSPAAAETIRKEIEQNTTVREKVSTSVDLPLSNECKRALSYAAEEAERLSHKHIGTEHLFLGLLREEKCLAATILRDRGVSLSSARAEFSRASVDSQGGERAKEPSLLSNFSTDLSSRTGELQKLIGRESELERLIHILCRFNRKNPVLVGEPGVGKKTIIGGLAQRIAEGSVPTDLEQRAILSLNLSLITAIEKDSSWLEKFQNALALPSERGAIFFVDELHEPAIGRLSGSSSIRVEQIIKGLLASGKIQCVSTATPGGYSKSIENNGWLEHYFQVVQVAPANEADAIEVLLGIKDSYEKFHGVTYTEEALTYAVYYASSCIKDRQLPGKAVDVIDEAGAYVKLRHSLLPEEIVEWQKRVRLIVKRMENAIANHEFEKARFYSDEERKERQNQGLLREKYKLDEAAVGSVTREVIEDVVARWTGMSVAAVRQSRATKLDDLEEKDS